jgi:hypothetical protein
MMQDFQIIQTGIERILGMPIILRDYVEAFIRAGNTNEPAELVEFILQNKVRNANLVGDAVCSNTL